MKPLSTLSKLGIITLLCISQASFAQEISRELRSFDRIIVSPRINLVLEKGDSRAILVMYAGVSAEKINIEIKNKTLRVFLDDAKMTEPTERVGGDGSRSIYRHADVTAYVTYTALEHLEIRGNQELTCNGELSARKLTLRAYGENIIDINTISAEYFKTSLYGENQLKVRDGKTDFQKYRLFGENKIDTHGMKSYAATTNTYGESRIHLNIHDELRVNAFGESEISYGGDANINRGLIFGQTRISRSR
jgi:hypothetical protein